MKKNEFITFFYCNIKSNYKNSRLTMTYTGLKNHLILHNHVLMIVDNIYIIRRFLCATETELKLFIIHTHKLLWLNVSCVSLLCILCRKTNIKYNSSLFPILLSNSYNFIVRSKNDLTHKENIFIGSQIPFIRFLFIYRIRYSKIK